MPPILIWNSCNYTYNSSKIGYPDYPLIYPNITCPFNCTFTHDRKL
ncbi:hypothetical protein Mgra_00003726 [Meloidogyne graminicola]|uniref:Uncharacterized protein n=1 Tax=Meloidogyne graminicola TaxID=189291 RepID=A0A8S9ZU50_9BILA|nr:hypothetical protein Mgra_00003726 [Meloidogyne graminicola]